MRGRAGENQARKGTGALRRWGVLIGLIGLQAGFIGIGVNSLSVVFAAILRDTGFSAGEFSVYYTISALAAALGIAPLTKLFLRVDGRWLLALLGTASAVGIGAMSLFTQVWHWYIAAAIVGFAGSLSPVVIPVIANNWFETQKGAVNGAIMAASGIAGAVLSPLCSVLIERLGWRGTTVVLMAMLFVSVVLSSVFLIRVSPRAGHPAPPRAMRGESPRAATAQVQRDTTPFCFLALLLFSLLVPRVLIQFCLQIPVYAASLGFSALAAGALTSLLMCGNIGGKLIFGAVLDKLGIYRVTAAIYGVAAAAFGMLLLGARVPACVYAGAFLLGGLYSPASLGIPMLCLDWYGPERYKERVAKLSVFPMVLAAFAGPAMAFVYDKQGTYNSVLLAGAAGCVAMVAAMRALKKGKQDAAVKPDREKQDAELPFEKRRPQRKMLESKEN